METIIKLRSFLLFGILALLGSMLQSQAQFPVGSYTNNFATGGNTSPFSGSGSVASWIYWYNTPGGNLPMTNDVDLPDPDGGAGAGSLEVDNPFTAAGTQNVFFGTFDNNYGYDFSVTANLLDFTNVSFDVYVGTNQAPNSSGNFGTLNVGVIDTGYGYEGFADGAVTIPGIASNGWVHLTVPVDHTIANITDIPGIAFNYNNYGGYPTTNLVFWLGNLVMTYVGVPPAPPTLTAPAKATHGLNIIASTDGNSYYDRQSILCNTNHGVSWVGQPGPVTYSFSIIGFPTAAANQYSMEAYMFLVPNPTANDNAPDYNESNCVIAEVQSTPAGSQLILQYKVNEPDGNGMQYDGAPYTNAVGSWNGVTTPWYENGALGTLQSTLLDGTYSLKFTSSSNITLITPDGSTTNLVIPPYNAGYFAENTSFNVYLGMQANNAASLNKAVVYGDFSMTGNVNPVSDDFLTDLTLNTNLWNATVANNPAGVIVAPASAAYWAYWSVPAPEYSLETGSNLLDIAEWTSPSKYPVIQTVGYYAQLVDQSELPAGNDVFFNCIERTFTHLQVLLPGETNAPGTATGVIGTPTPVSLSGSGGQVNVTVNAVDSTFHIINGINDTIALTSSDTAPIGAALPSPQAMANGTVTFTTFEFSDQGSFTITAADNTSTNIPSATSLPVTVGP